MVHVFNFLNIKIGINLANFLYSVFACLALCSHYWNLSNVVKSTHQRKDHSSNVLRNKIINNAFQHFTGFGVEEWTSFPFKGTVHCQTWVSPFTLTTAVYVESLLQGLYYSAPSSLFQSRLLATFNCKMVAIQKFSCKKKVEGEDTSWHITRRYIFNTSLCYSKRKRRIRLLSCKNDLFQH